LNFAVWLIERDTNFTTRLYKLFNSSTVLCNIGINICTIEIQSDGKKSDGKK